MRFKINSNKPKKNVIKQSIDALKEGKVILYPTDTVYGIGANIFDIQAVKKVYSIKKRSLDKPLSVCVSKIEDIHKIAHLDEPLENMINDILPGPFTVILNKKEIVHPILTAGGDKIGIRIPDNKICIELSKEFPLTTTSANLSGKPVPESVDGVLEQLEDKIDLIIDAGTCKHGVHSTVLDMTMNPPKILRQGARIPKFNYDH